MTTLIFINGVLAEAEMAQILDISSDTVTVEIVSSSQQNSVGKCTVIVFDHSASARYEGYFCISYPQEKSVCATLPRK